MTTQLNKARTYTVEEFMSLPDDGKRYELIEGKLKDISGEERLKKLAGPNMNHGRITTRLVVSIANYLTGAGKESGEVFTNMAFELAPKTAPKPDVAFITAERTTGVDSSKAFPGPPDLAVEIMSPTDKWSEVIEKVKLYQRYQTRLVWVVDPFDQGVFVYQLGRNRRRLLLATDELTGENVIPGFTLAVKALFD
jgi:Uma2 family endonuclease